MTSGPSHDIKLSDAEYDQFCEFFYRRTGIRFGPQKRYFVDKRIANKARDVGDSDFAQYFRRLRFETDDKEFQRLVDAMTVNETYFYREIEQLDVLVRRLLPNLISDRPDDGELRIWSCPCSSGEEAYSIAFKLLEEFSEVDRFDISLFGTDIDSKMVEKAKEGLYADRSVHLLSKHLLNQYFRQEEDGRWRVIEELRKSIEFRRVNVLDRGNMSRFKNMDVIFCRNMLIYFDDISRKLAVDAFFDALSPGGYLLLGMSESLGRTTALFDVVREGGMTVYQKPHREGRRR